MTSKKASKPTATIKVQVLHFLEDNSHKDAGHSPVTIASELKLNYNSVRTACLKMAKDGVILRERPGLCTFYKAKLGYEAKLYRSKQFPNAKYPEVHQLTLHITEVHRKEGLGVCCRFCDEPLTTDFQFCTHCGLNIPRFGFTYHAEMSPLRHITYVFGKHKNSLTVKLGCSDEPLGFEDFKQFLTAVEFLTNVKVWKQLHKWKVKQWGLNADKTLVGKQAKITSNEEVTLFGFGNWLARRYKKKFPDGTVKMRNELHGTEAQDEDPITAENFMAMVMGNVTASQAVSMVAATNKRIDNLTREFRIFIKYVAKIFSKDHKDDSDEEAAPAAPNIRRPKDQ